MQRSTCILVCIADVFLVLLSLYCKKCGASSSFCGESELQSLVFSNVLVMQNSKLGNFEFCYSSFVFVSSAQWFETTAHLLVFKYVFLCF